MGHSSIVLALEPANKCTAHCTFCFAELNKKSQANGKQRRDEDPGTFEATIEKAFGPNYDPTNFLQYSLKNRYPLGYANTVEPWMDVLQATSIHKTCDKLNLPLFLQSRGTNFEEIWSSLRPLHDNAVLFVSFPSPDDRVIKRFEPGTPKAAQRWTMIERASNAGFHVILALAPYHEDWIADPYSFVKEAVERGVGGVFLDRLHLNRRQVEACTDPVTIALSKAEPGPKLMGHLRDIHQACADANIAFHTLNSACTELGLLNTQRDLSPPNVFKRGQDWNYSDSAFLLDLDHITFAQDPSDDGPVVVEWAQALAAMEAEGRIDQPFSMSSMRDLMCVKNLAPAWIRSLGKAAPIREYYRALWNSPSKTTFGWHHRYTRIATDPKGEPYRDGQANLVMLYDPNFHGTGQTCEVADLDELPRYDAAGDPDPIEAPPL